MDFKNMTDKQYIKLHKEIIHQQKEVCKKYGLEWFPSPPDFKIGISKNLKSGIMPINGLRHPVEKGTAGWYIWAGDYLNSKDFFVPMHIDHLDEYFPMVLKYLGLPPGWRFQIDDKGYEDVWEDKSLLKI